MKRIITILLLAVLLLSSQLLLSACAHDEEIYGGSRLDLPLSSRTVSQTQAE